MGCSKQCSTKLYVPHLPSTEGSEGGVAVPAMHQINFEWPKCKHLREVDWLTKLYPECGDQTNINGEWFML
eukprot:scaffold314937_cov51-Attheya_sp.AAC.2